MEMRGRVCLRSLLVLALSMVVSAPAIATDSRSVRRCDSSDLRYAFRAGGPKDFGVFRLRIDGGRCRTAHEVAKDWKRRFETSFRARHLRLPKSVDAFSFTNLPVRAAQTYRERGRKGATTIWFNYVVPNG
jgi:hypothetical protein